MSGVKELEWEYREQQSMTYVVRRHWGIEYFINQSFGSDTYYFTTVNHEGRILYDGDDLPSAQAAAQADYEPRILSALTDEARAALSDKETFQNEVDRWLIACFGLEIARDKVERNHRFLEEALELVQSGGCTASEAHQLVDYVFDRPVGEMWQEVGGVMNTLAALCLAYDLDMADCGNREIARCWTKVEKIRAKQAAKPKHSPLPEHVPAKSSDDALREAVEQFRRGYDLGFKAKAGFDLRNRLSALVQEGE